MTPGQADGLTSRLSAQYGTWGEIKKRDFAASIQDLPFAYAQTVVSDWIRMAVDHWGPTPGEIRTGVNALIARSPQGQIADERESGIPVERAEGAKLFRAMLKQLQLKGEERRRGIQSLADLLGRGEKPDA